MSDDAARRRAERHERARYHAEEATRRKARESAMAQVLLDDFVRRAREADLPLTELTARPYSGPGRYRTGVQGWYLRRDRSIGLGPDGAYYVLVVPPRLTALVRGIAITASAPPMQVGEGARDGESIALESLLALRLEAGTDFP